MKWFGFAKTNFPLLISIPFFRCPKQENSFKSIWSSLISAIFHYNRHNQNVNRRPWGVVPYNPPTLNSTHSSSNSLSDWMTQIRDSVLRSRRKVGWGYWSRFRLFSRLIFMHNMRLQTFYFKFAMTKSFFCAIHFFRPAFKLLNSIEFLADRLSIHEFFQKSLKNWKLA